MSFHHMLDHTLPLSAQTATMVGGVSSPFVESMVNPALPLTGAWDRRRIMAMQEDVFDDEDDIFDDEDDEDDEGNEDDEDDELGWEGEYDDFGEDDIDLYGEDDEDDFGEDDEDDFGEDDDEFGLSARRRARLLGKRRKLTALWVAAAGRPNQRRRLRRQITKISTKLGMPLPPQLQNVIEERQARRALRRARRGVVSVPSDRRIFKPGAFRKPAPVPGAPAAVVQPTARPVVPQFVAPGMVTAPVAPVPEPRSRYIPASQAARRRAMLARRTERIAPGVRRGPGGAVYTRQGPGQWTRVGPRGGVQEITRQPDGGMTVERLGAEPRMVNNIGAALIAFPFQSLVLVGAAAMGGAVAAPFLQNAWNRLTGR